MREKYKIYNYLFDEEYLTEVSLNAKVAYGIYVDMLNGNINVKQDERGYKYIENARKYIMNELEICANTATKIHKELIDAGLIEEEWQGLNLPYRTYIKYYETIDLENTKEYKPILEELPDIKFKDTGFTNLDIREAKKVIIERFGEFPFFEVGKIVEKTNLKQFHLNDIKMIKYAIAYMLAKYRDVANIKEMLNKISYITIYSALDRTSKIKGIEPKVCILAKEIFEIISNK